MNRWVFSLLLLLLFMLACAPFGAFKPAATNTPALKVKTGEISGKVFDSSSGESVSIAGVSTDPPTSSVTTGAEGDYSIPDISPGDYTVTVTKSGYESASVDVAVVAGKITTADLHLIAVSANSRESSTIVLGLVDGLVAYYPFNGNADDESGNGNYGTVQDAELTSDRFGNEDSAYHFNGQGSHIEVPDSRSLNPSSYTISVWVFVDPNAMTKTTDIISKDGEGYERQFLIARTPKGHFRVHAAEAGGRFLYFDGTVSPSPQQWYHLVETWDGASLGLYVNGEQDPPTHRDSRNVGVTFSGQPIRIGGGAPEGQNQYWFEGVIDDIRIYDRVISKAEI